MTVPIDDGVIRDRSPEMPALDVPGLGLRLADSRAVTRWADACAVMAGTALAVEMRAEPGTWFTLSAVWLWLIAVVIVVRSDLTDFIIPDGATAFIAVLGLANAVVSAWQAGAGREDAISAGVAAVSSGCLGFALFWSIGWCFRRFGQREALGFGDVKLAGALAIWLAPADAALALEVAALAAIVVLLLGQRGGPLREIAIPFGAFMAPAAWLAFLLGPWLRQLAGWP